MKVLHIEAGRHLYGGAQQVDYLVRALREHGVDSTLICAEGAAVGEALEGVCPVHPVRLAGDLDVLAIGRLTRVMASVQPDLVHLHSRRGADTLGAIAARAVGLPVVLSRRVDNPEPRWWVPIKYRLYDRVIAISEGIARVLRQGGVPDHKVRCVRSAVDFAAFDQRPDPRWFRQAFALPPQATTLGVVAQLIPRKGHRYLFAALPRLLDMYPTLHVLIFGRGPLDAALRQAASGLSPRIHFAGFREDLTRVLPNLNVLVHPAEIEGLGVSLMQAAAAGVPIVASATGGIPEVVEDGHNGLLVPPGDVSALEDALAHLLGDPALARAMGEAGKRRAQSEFTIAAMAAGNLAVYREVLEADHERH